MSRYHITACEVGGRRDPSCDSGPLQQANKRAMLGPESSI